MGWAYSMSGAKRNAQKILVGKPKEKRPLGTPRRRTADNNEMDLRGLAWCGMN
jgi:hypothetical protein